MYTDGINEAMNPERSVYGSKRVRQTLRSGPKPIDELCQQPADGRQTVHPQASHRTTTSAWWGSRGNRGAARATMPEQPVLRAVVFDLDGLMVNTEELHDEVGEILLQRRGCHFSQQLKREIMGRPARVSLQIMIDRHRPGPRRSSNCRPKTDELFAELLPVRLRPLPGLEELLTALESAAIPKAIATSSGRLYTATVLSQVGFERRFQFVLTAEDVRRGKAGTGGVFDCGRQFGVPPAALMVLEDSENGCRAGVAAGAYTVAVPGPHSQHHDFDGVALGRREPGRPADLPRLASAASDLTIDR